MASIHTPFTFCTSYSVHCVCVCMIYMSTCNRHICRWCGIESCVELSQQADISRSIWMLLLFQFTHYEDENKNTNTKWKYIRIKSNVSCAYVMRRMATTTTTIWIVSLQFSLLDVFFSSFFFQFIHFQLTIWTVWLLCVR